MKMMNVLCSLHTDEHEPKHKEVMQKLEQLVDSLESAYAAPTKQDALDILNGEYGDRVQDLVLSYLKQLLRPMKVPL